MSLLMVSTALSGVQSAEAQQSASLIDLSEVNPYAEEVVGLSNTGGRAAVNTSVYGRNPEAHLWDGQQMIGAGGLDRNVNSRATAISGDGSTLVGRSEDSYGATRAFRWTQAGGIVDLGTLSANNRGISIASDVSDNGSRVVGYTSSILNQTLAFAWVEGAQGGQSADGQMFALMPLADGVGSIARGISGNGDYAVGVSLRMAGADTGVAARWDIANLEDGQQSVRSLGTLGGNVSEARAISDDGTIIVGFSTSGSGRVEAFRWVENGTGGSAANPEMQSLGVLPGYERGSDATAVSGDGRVVVGHSAGESAESQSLETAAFRWDEAGGMVSVGDWLVDNGVDIGSHQFHSANAVSQNGDVVAGSMWDPNDLDAGYHAYIARVDRSPGGGGTGVMDVQDYQRSLFSTTQVANAGEFLAWLPMNGAHHRPLMQQGSLSGDTCLWATGDLAQHGSSNTALGLGEVGACVDLFGGTVRAGLGVGTSHSWQSLARDGSSRLTGQYVLGEVDWQPDGTPLLLSLTGMLGGWQANIHRGYGNGAATAYSDSQTGVSGGVIRLRADWLEAAKLGNTTLNPWAAFSIGRTDVAGYVESGGPFPARFNGQSLVTHEVRLGLTAETELSDATALSTTFEVAHRGGQAPSASGNVVGLFDFNIGGGHASQTWGRVGAELDHKLGDNGLVSLSLNAATQGRDATIGGSIGLKATF